MKVSIPSSGETVTGTLHFPQNLKSKNPAILFIHGWTSNEDGYHPRAQALTKLGYISLTINLRGHGTSSGKLEDYSRKDHLEDSLAAYDFLANENNVDINNISIVGASYGGYLGAIVARKRTVKNLAMRAPALYLNTDFDKKTAELINDREGEFFKNFQLDEQNFALEGIKHVANLLLVKSEFDQIIPHNIIELYKQNTTAKVTHEIIKGANHQLSEEKWKQEFIEILASWFDKLIPTP